MLSSLLLFGLWRTTSLSAWITRTRKNKNHYVTRCCLKIKFFYWSPGYCQPNWWNGPIISLCVSQLCIFLFLFSCLLPGVPIDVPMSSILCPWQPQAVPWRHRAPHCPPELGRCLCAWHPKRLSFCRPSWECSVVGCPLLALLVALGRLTLLPHSPHSHPEQGKLTWKTFWFSWSPLGFNTFLLRGGGLVQNGVLDYCQT